MLRHDGAETRRADGALVPVAELEPLLPGPVPAGDHGIDWTRFGAGPCAPELARREPAAVRAMLMRLGDARLAAKSARLEARLTLEPPGEVLYQELWDGLGYSANREPMRELARALPLAAVEDALATVPAEERIGLSRGFLFGVAGFLPLSPGDAAMARLDVAGVALTEARWGSHGGAWHGEALTPTRWTRARVRPANHQVARLAAGAALLAGAPGGLIGALLGAVRAGTDVVRLLRELSGTAGAPAIGADRAAGMVANSVLPFALTLAEQTGDAMLSEAAASAWERFPAAEGNATARRALLQVAGGARLPGLGARGQQGLLQLDATLCAPRRCFECPIAAAVVADEKDAAVRHPN
ncbi:MAG: DUF2851 family protein [Chloroflexota bacterium]|nr:DUF2851 family protein [Chloroflexota bacterium]